ncbi:MAG: acetoacetate decarboxylase family protein, partial [Proteobacteria bacterium]|nr:acetoacetate decarboxylase family protein [Pseudomonadota bacterium]
MAEPQSAYVFQGRPVPMPVHVRDASTGAAQFFVSAREAARLLPSEDFEIAEVWPGRAILSLAAIDYRDNDLGDYNEVSIAFFVRPRGDRPAIPYLGNFLDLFRGKLGTFIYRLPVNQSFTRDAGEGIWGFPKTVEQIDMEKTATSCTCRLVMDGQHV